MAKAVETAANATAAAIAGGVSEAKMDELIKAIDRLTDAVKALAPQK
jgi:outer membrane murein-binding lipoprotein Lpp